MTEEKTIEERIAKILEMKESGQNDVGILKAFHKDREKTEEIIKTINLIKQEKEKIDPGRASLEKALGAIISSETAFEKRGVTIDALGRYKEEAGSRAGQSIKSLMGQIHETMTSKYKIVLPIGALVVLLLVFGISQFSKKGSFVSKEGGESVIAEKATGDIDDIASVLDKLAFYETSDFDSDEDYVSIASADSQALSDFGQSYNE